MSCRALGLMFAALFAVRWSVDAQVPCPPGSSQGMRCVEKRQFDERFKSEDAADVFARVMRYSGAPDVTVARVEKEKAVSNPKPDAVTK